MPSQAHTSIQAVLTKQDKTANHQHAFLRAMELSVCGTMGNSPWVQKYQVEQKITCSSAS